MATTRVPTTTHALDLLTPEEVLGDAGLRRDWESLMSLGHTLNRVLASPTFYEHQCQVAPLPENRVVVIRNDEGRIVGICPIVLWRLTMTLQIKRHVLSRMRLRTATILSGEPLLPPDPALFRLLFDGLLEAFPWADCVHINSMPADSFTCKFIYEDQPRSRHYLVHPPKLEAGSGSITNSARAAKSFSKKRRGRPATS